MGSSDRPVDDYSQDSGSDWSKSSYGWSDLSKALTEYDDCKIKDCKEDIDTLLVFVSGKPPSMLYLTLRRLSFRPAFFLQF